MKSVTVTPGVTERPPLPGLHYVGFVVHPRKPGPMTLAIAHKDGNSLILDLLRDGLTIEQCSHPAHAYGVTRLTGADDEGDGSDSLLHATAGVLSLLK
jgi:hypothetical protein